jgi:hypothetical protein
MRALVAITCVAVLAAIGYFFWSEYRVAKRQADDELASANKAEAARLTARAAELVSSGRCTAIAKALTDSQGSLPATDLADARTCAQYGQLTAFERHSFDLYPDAIR